MKNKIKFNGWILLTVVFSSLFTAYKCSAQQDTSYNLSAGFTKNMGQIFDTDSNQTEEVLYYGPNGNTSYFLSNNKISYVLSHTDSNGIADSLYRMDLVFEESSESPDIEEKTQLYYKNYHNQASAIEDVPVFNEIVYKGIINNIDLTCNILGELQLQFKFAAGTSPNNLKFYFDGADSMTVDTSGALRVYSIAGIVKYDSIFAYQVISGAKVDIGARINKDGNNRLYFTPDTYNTSYALVIGAGSHGPKCCWAVGNYWTTFLQSSGINYNMDVSIDANNNVYATGACTNDIHFPIQNGQYFAYYGGSHDAYVFKFDSHRKILWGNYFGGSAYEQGLQVAANSQGFVYLIGVTNSQAINIMCSNCTSDPLLNKVLSSGGQEIFIAKYGSNGYLGGVTGAFATYFGPSVTSGANNATVGAMTIDQSDNVYFGGHVNSTAYQSFPFVQETSAYNQNFKITYDGTADAFITKLSPSNTVLWSCAISGDGGNEYITGMSSANNKLYVTGCTNSDGQVICNTPPCSGANNNPTEFPLANPTGSYFKSANSGGANGLDAFMMVFNINDQIEWSTLFGGTGDENDAIGTDLNSGGIAVANNGNIFVTGFTSSSTYGTPPTANFPQVVLSGANKYNQSSFGGGEDAFIAMFNSSYQLQWSTYYGGSSQDKGVDIATSTASGYGFVYITGITGSSSSSLMKVLAGSNNYNQATNNGSSDAYIQQFSADGNYLYGSWFGGSGFDECYGIATDASGNHILISGESFFAPNTTAFPFKDPTPNLVPGSSNKAYFYGIPQQNPPSYDAFIANLYNGCTSCARYFGEDDITHEVNAAIQVYPNPAGSYLRIVFKNVASIKSVSIYNCLGKQINSFSYPSNPLYVGNLASGIYLLKAEDTEGKSYNTKFLVK